MIVQIASSIPGQDPWCAKVVGGYVIEDGVYEGEEVLLLELASGKVIAKLASYCKEV